MYNVELHEVSAKSSQNIEEVMNRVGSLLIKREEKNKISKTPEIYNTKPMKLGNKDYKKVIKDKIEGLNHKCSGCKN